MAIQLGLRCAAKPRDGSGNGAIEAIRTSGGVGSGLGSGKLARQVAALPAPPLL